MRRLLVACLAAGLSIALRPGNAPGADGLAPVGRSFDPDSRIVSTVVFLWFTPTTGQQVGPWPPIEGRDHWTGEPDWWQGQVKQMMAAGFDLLYVHLTDSWHEQRYNLFRALGDLRAAGYDVPRVAPFLDPAIVWWQRPKPNLATEAGRDEFVAHYIRFYQQYFAANQDPAAESYLAQMVGRPILATWHVGTQTSNVLAFSSQELENRLCAALGGAHPLLCRAPYVVVPSRDSPTFVFAAERLVLFETTAYHADVTFNGIRAVQLKGGYWDQNIRTPGSFRARGGGLPYVEAWGKVDRARDHRVYVESWNEYDEGTGIYAALAGPPYIHPGSANPNTDVWSASGDPFEYIRTTAEGARRFNDTPDLDARVLLHDFPAAMPAGATRTVRVVVRNTGDRMWTGAEGFRFAQRLDGPDDAPFQQVPAYVDDTANEIDLYGGVFRGRPVAFDVALRAPAAPGCYLTRWGMAHDGEGAFGDEVSVTISTVEGPCADCPTCPPTPTFSPTPTRTPTWVSPTPTLSPTITSTNTPRPRTPTPTVTPTRNDHHSLMVW